MNPSKHNSENYHQTAPRAFGAKSSSPRCRVCGVKLILDEVKTEYCVTCHKQQALSI